MREKNRGGIRRVSKDKTRSASKKSKSGGYSVLNLPDGVSSWVPEKAGSYNLDIIPYVVSIDHHPDEVEKGVLWWRMLYGVHRNIGVDKIPVVCPKSIGKPCPICEFRAELAKDYEANKAQIRPITSQKMAVVNLRDPDDPDGVVVFPYAHFSFMKLLDTEITAAEDDSDINFYDVNKDGRTLKTRFDKEAFTGEGVSGSFLKVSKIEFKPRAELDEAETLAKTVTLDSALIIKSYDEIQALFDSAGDEGDDEDTDEVEETPKKKSRPAPVEDEDDDDDEVEEPAPKKKAKPPVEEDDEEDEPPVKASKKSKPPIEDDDDDDPPPVKKKKPKPSIEDDDED